MSKRSFQKSIDGESIIIPKQLLEARPLELSAKAFKELQPPKPPREKKPMTEAQKAALEKMIAANKERKRLRQEAEKANQLPPVMIEEEKEFKEKLKEVKKEVRQEKKAEDEKQKLESGNFIKVIVKKATRKKRIPIVISETPTETETDITETEDDTDIEEYKSKARAVRKAAVAKKLVKTVEKIDRVIQQAPMVPANPYANLLASRWR